MSIQTSDHTFLKNDPDEFKSYNHEISTLLEKVASDSVPPPGTFHGRLSPLIPILSIMLILSLIACAIFPNRQPSYTDGLVYLDDSYKPPNRTSAASKKTTSSKSKSRSSSKSNKPKSSKASSSKEHSNKNQQVYDASDQEDFQPEGKSPPDASYYPFNEVGNSSSNIQNGSFMAMQGDWIYYINSEDNHTLYKMRNSGEEDQKVCDISASSISLIGETALVGCLEWDNTLQDVRWDGSGTQMFTVGCNNITAYTHFMITSDSFGIYRTDYSGGLREKLYSGSPTRCCCENGRIYFVEEDGLYSISMDSQDDLQLEVPGPVQSYAVTDDNIYYCMRNHLYSKDSPNQPLLGLQTSCINITDGVLFYADQLDGQAVYSVNLDGSDHKYLSEHPAQAICVAGDWIAIESNGEIILL